MQWPPKTQPRQSRYVKLYIKFNPFFGCAVNTRIFGHDTYWIIQ